MTETTMTPAIPKNPKSQVGQTRRDRLGALFEVIDDALHVEPMSHDHQEIRYADGQTFTHDRRAIEEFSVYVSGPVNEHRDWQRIFAARVDLALERGDMAALGLRTEAAKAALLGFYSSDYTYEVAGIIRLLKLISSYESNVAVEVAQADAATWKLKEALAQETLAKAASQPTAKVRLQASSSGGVIHPGAVLYDDEHRDRIYSVDEPTRKYADGDLVMIRGEHVPEIGAVLRFKFAPPGIAETVTVAETLPRGEKSVTVATSVSSSAAGSVFAHLDETLKQHGLEVKASKADPDVGRVSAKITKNIAYFNGRKIPCNQITVINNGTDKGTTITIVGEMSAERSSNFMDLLVRGDVIGSLHLVTLSDAPIKASLLCVTQNVKEENASKVHTVLTFSSKDAKDVPKATDLAPGVAALKDLAEPLRAGTSSTALNRDKLAQDWLDHCLSDTRRELGDGLAKAAYAYADEMIRTSANVPADVKLILDGTDSEPWSPLFVVKPNVETHGALDFTVRPAKEPFIDALSRADHKAEAAAHPTARDGFYATLNARAISYWGLTEHEAIKALVNGVARLCVDGRLDQTGRPMSGATPITDLAHELDIFQRSFTQIADAIKPVRATGSTVLGVVQELVTIAVDAGVKPL